MGKDSSYTPIIQGFGLVSLTPHFSSPLIFCFLCILRESKISHYSFRNWLSSFRGVFYGTKLALGAISHKVTSDLLMGATPELR